MVLPRLGSLDNIFKLEVLQLLSFILKALSFFFFTRDTTNVTMLIWKNKINFDESYYHVFYTFK